MNRLDLIKRVRALTRDFSNAIFREFDIIDYINEGVERVTQVVPQTRGMELLLDNTQEPTHLPAQYHHLLALYSASRCFGQDERHYQASNFMNEFETKIEEMRTGIENGTVAILDPTTGKVITSDGSLGTDYVDTSYFENRFGGYDRDEGVEGV